MSGFPPACHSCAGTVKGNGAGTGASGDGEWQRDELLSGPSSVAVSWEAAEELLWLCVKSYIPRGSDWMPGTFLRCPLTWLREAQLGWEERGRSGSQVVCRHLSLVWAGHVGKAQGHQR